jgi:hypothetical protein
VASWAKARRIPRGNDDDSHRGMPSPEVWVAPRQDATKQCGGRACQGTRHHLWPPPTPALPWAPNRQGHPLGYPDCGRPDDRACPSNGSMTTWTGPCRRLSAAALSAAVLTLLGPRGRRAGYPSPAGWRPRPGRNAGQPAPSHGLRCQAKSDPPRPGSSIGPKVGCPWCPLTR